MAIVTVAASVAAAKSGFELAKTLWAVGKKIGLIARVIQSAYGAELGTNGVALASCVWKRISWKSLVYRGLGDSLSEDSSRGSRLAGIVYSTGGKCGVPDYVRLRTSQAIYSVFGNNKRATEREKQAQAAWPAFEKWMNAQKAALTSTIQIPVKNWGLFAADPSVSVDTWLKTFSDSGKVPQKLPLASLQGHVAQVKQDKFIKSSIKALLMRNGQWPEFLKLYGSNVPFKSFTTQAKEIVAARFVSETRPENIEQAIHKWLRARESHGLKKLTELAKNAKIPLGVYANSQVIDGIDAATVKSWWDELHPANGGGGGIAWLAAAAIAAKLLLAS